MTGGGVLYWINIVDWLAATFRDEQFKESGCTIRNIRIKTESRESTGVLSPFCRHLEAPYIT